MKKILFSSLIFASCLRLFATVSSTTAFLQYTLTTNPQALPVTFVFTNSADLQVLDARAGADPVTLTINSDYSVTGGLGSTGTVTTIAGGSHGVLVGDVITIVRNVPLTQTTNYTNTGPLTAAIIGASFDKLTEITQQINLRLAGTLQFPVNEALSGNLLLSARASKLLGFDSSGALAYYANAGAPSSYVASITGTANQVIASAATGAVTLSLPQSIGTGSSPVFTGLTLSGLSSAGVVVNNGSGVISGIANGGNGSFLGVSGGVLGFYTPSSSGTVSSGTINRIPYYAAAGTTISNSPTVAVYGTNGLQVFSADTTATVIDLQNTSAGGHEWQILSLGSSSGTGKFRISDNMSGGSRLSLDTGGLLQLHAYTTAGPLTNDGSGNVVSIASGGNGTFLGVSGSILGFYTPAGSGTVVSGTAGQSTWYPTSTSSVSGNSGLTFDTTSKYATFSPTAGSGVSGPYFQLAPGNDLLMPAGAESIGVSFGNGQTRQFASNTAVTTQREHRFGLMTYSFQTATGTITNAATVAISGAPIAGTNAIITNPFAFWVQGGTSRFDGNATLSPIARTTTAAALPYFLLTTPADTAITASTQSIGFSKTTATRQWAPGTVADQPETFLAGVTLSGSGATAIFTDAFTLKLTPPIQGSNATITRGHSLGILDSTSAASSITGGLVVSTTFGTAATSVGIGGGNINAGGSITASQTAGYIGTTTNNAANAGSIGEILSGSASGVSLTSGSSLDVVTLSLTAGDWDVTATAFVVPAGSTTITIGAAGLNTTTNTLPATNDPSYGQSPYTQTGVSFTINCNRKQFLLSGTTTVRLIVNQTFAVSTCTAGGSIYARRMR